MTERRKFRREDHDWTELKGVVAVLWLAAVLVFLVVHYSLPQDQVIVLDAKVTPLKLAGSANP
jgi:hypothetical protein